MRAFIVACIALVAITVGANWTLKEAGFSTADQTKGQAVRLD